MWQTTPPAMPRNVKEKHPKQTVEFWLWTLKKLAALLLRLLHIVTLKLSFDLQISGFLSKQQMPVLIEQREFTEKWMPLSAVSLEKVSVWCPGEFNLVIYPVHANFFLSVSREFTHLPSEKHTVRAAGKNFTHWRETAWRRWLLIKCYHVNTFLNLVLHLWFVCILFLPCLSYLQKLWSMFMFILLFVYMCVPQCGSFYFFYLFLIICFSIVSRRSTSKLAWSECMDFSDTQKYVISDLGGLKKFFNQGLYVSIEEEKVKNKERLWDLTFTWKMCQMWFICHWLTF